MEGVRRRFALRLPAKLALAALALLALPWAGVSYVNEMERVLLAGQERALLAAARAVATALHDRPQLLATLPARDDAVRREAELELQRIAQSEGRLPQAAIAQLPLAREAELAARKAQEEIAAILRGVQRTESRLWVVNRRYQVLALEGSLRRPQAAREEDGAVRRAWRRTVGWLIERPNEDFAEAVPDNVLATGRDIASALQGTPGTRTRRTPDGRAVVMSAAHPVWSGNEVAGAVVVEETTNPIASLRSDALERLLLLTLAAFAGTAALLIGFATRLSQRIRRLRDEAESAIDARGRLARIAAGSDAGDEIGDLSRSFSAMLARLAQHHAYLESMAGRLSHELRTPIAVVRSSLENLKLAATPEEIRTYVARADEGLGRLNTILQRMSEATRLEQSLRTAERERYDLVTVVRGCVEGYRLAYAPTPLALELPGRALEVSGSPDLGAQMLDKLVENAVEFSAPGEAVRIELEDQGRYALLAVHNKGPRLPVQMRARLFESMVSVRETRSGSAPHLGLGLYVARLIAEFHGGAIEAADAASGDGVVLRVHLPLAR
ncbi:MAG: ATP-binding protein [Betaproteobacteria bacterium]|nr:ATP-binding protein [Betaproteobacteria bacterium]